MDITFTLENRTGLVHDINRGSYMSTPLVADLENFTRVLLLLRHR